MKKTKKRYYLNFKTIKRNLLIITFLIVAIQYFKFMTNYNKKLFADNPTRDETISIIYSSEIYKKH